MGTFMHDVMETLYKDITGKKITTIDVRQMKLKVEGLTRAAFTKKFSASEISHGKNLLTLNVAIKLINNFLDGEIEFLQELEKQGKPLFIKSLEENLEMQLNCNINGSDKIIKLHGKADRIDQMGAITRVIDYKTGFVNEAHLRNQLMEDITCNPDKGKSLQLLTYALMYQKMHPEITGNLQSGIICFRKLSAGIMNFSFDKSDNINTDLLQLFEDELKKLITQIYNTTLTFEHRKESEYCVFCNG